jgi:hypothetical protein
MSGSLYLNTLTSDQRKELEKQCLRDRHGAICRLASSRIRALARKSRSICAGSRPVQNAEFVVVHTR